MSGKPGFQGPTNGEIATSYGSLLTIITHPAFRIGFLDAQLGRPLDHDLIGERIKAETPPSYFKRQGIAADDLFARPDIRLAQYRYEEGRLAYLMLGLRCKAWGHPDFPPKSLRDYIWERADKTVAPAAAPTAASIVGQLRGAFGIGPLFEVRAA